LMCQTPTGPFPKKNGTSSGDNLNIYGTGEQEGLAPMWQAEVMAKVKMLQICKPGPYKLCNKQLQFSARLLGTFPLPQTHQMRKQQRMLAIVLEKLLMVAENPESGLPKGYLLVMEVQGMPQKFCQETGDK